MASSCCLSTIEIRYRSIDMPSSHRVCLYLAALAALSCGDDSTPTTYANTDAAADCEQLAGTWTITQHCSAALNGTQVTVTQEACTITTEGAFPGFTGEVKRDGSFNMNGTSNGVAVSCTGMATAKRITESCTGNCEVVLTR